MNVQELIHKLSSLPEDLQVYVHDGLDPSDLCEAKSVDAQRVYGPYPQEKAVVILS